MGTSKDSTRYVLLTYPKVIISSDLGGLPLSMGLLAKVNKLKRGSKKQGPKFLFPDFSFPYEARGGWFSFSIELKATQSG